VPVGSRLLAVRGLLLMTLVGMSTLMQPATAMAQDAAPPGAAASAALNGPSANALSRQERNRISSRVWRTDAILEASTIAPAERAWSDDPQLIERGRRLFLEGQRADGSPLVGRRLDGQIRLSGATAACSLCHRRSGLGAVEGPNQIAPISGRYLFDQDRRALVNMSLRARKAFNPRHDPYSIDTLAQALRLGRHESGRDMDPLMPRYELDDTDVLALASYLRRISNAWSPGVSDMRVKLATVIAPDIDPERKRIFLATLNGIVAQKNGNMVRGQRTMSSGAEMALQTDRSWDMQVWELHGAPSTWQAQLDSYYDAQPVFAVASGLGGAEWNPVHRFCEARGVPCWFPSVGAVPEARNGDFYSVYFSRGAGLEADVLARQLELAAKPGRPTGRVLQVYADDGVADTAVAGLRKRLNARKAPVTELRLGDRAGLASALRALGPGDSVVFWLTPTGLEALNGLPVTKAKPYFSASLGGGDSLPLDAAWRSAARVVYPYQLPELRQRGMTVFREWMRIRKLPVEDEVLQSEVYFALDYLNDTLVDMLDNVHRDYLLERGENMLSLREAARAEDQARDLSLPKSNLIDRNVQPLRPMGQRMIIPRASAHSTLAQNANAAPMAATHGQGPLIAMADAPGVAGQAQAGSATASKEPEAMAPAGNETSALSGAPSSTNAYPRLSLGQFQRYASKGAYIVRLGPVGGSPMQVESDWLVP
jgi:hypothetical protein